MPNTRTIRLPDPAVFGNTLDYVAFIKDHVQPNLHPTGHGRPNQNSGNIIFDGNFLFDRQLNLHPLNRLKGATALDWSYGPSTSVRPSNEWASGNGAYIYRRGLPAPNTHYSNFYSGATDINFCCYSPNKQVFVNGPYEVLSQQSRLKIRAYGYEQGRTGLTIGGDVWTGEDIIVDSRMPGTNGVPIGHGSTGIKTNTVQIRQVDLEKVSIHNNEYGIHLHNVLGGNIKMESETTHVPFLLTYSACDLDVYMSVQHHNYIARIDRAVHGNFDIRLHGNAELGRHCIRLPDGKLHWVHRFADSKNPKVLARARSKSTPGAIPFDVRIWKHGSKLVIDDRKK